LTGGNPRLLIIISNFVAQSSFKELMANLTRLVDEHTEYFKSHLDNLPAQERKVFVTLADIWNPASAKEIADLARIGVNKVSAHLQRLMSKGAVVVANQQGGKKLYQVAERMYNIYHLMRRRGAPARRVRAVVNFMVSFYEPEELVRTTSLIAQEACKLDPPQREAHYLVYQGVVEKLGDDHARQTIVANTPSDFFSSEFTPQTLRQLAHSMGGEEIVLPFEATKVKTPSGDMVKKAFELAQHPEKLLEAERVLREAVDLHPEDASVWANLGKFLHQRLNRYDEAEVPYRKAIELDPKYYRAWAHLGQLLHQRLERYEEAEVAYRKAIELDPKHHWPWEQLGLLLYERLERYEEAELTYRKAIKLEPDCPIAWANLGQLLHQRLNRYDEAEVAYRKAIELDPKYDWAWAHLGQLLHERLNRYDEAEVPYRKAIELEPKYHWAWEKLGLLLHEQLERYDEAEVAYRNAIELGPDCPIAWAHLGQLLHQRLERYDEAEVAYRKAIELNSKYDWAWAHLGQLLHQRLNRYDEAEVAYRKAIELDSKHHWPWEQLGLLLHERLNRYEEAELAYRKAIELGPDCPIVWAQLGRLLHERLERYDEAEAAYRKAIELDPKFDWAWARVIALKLYSGLGPLDEILNLAEDCIRKCSESANLYNSLAWDFFKHAPTSYLSKAQVWALKAVELEPENPHFEHTLASILTIIGSPEESLQHATKYLTNRSVVKSLPEDGINLFVNIAAAGCPREALNLLQGSPNADLMEPLIAGLRLFLDEEVRVPVEVLEVAKDVKKRIMEQLEKLNKENAI